MTIYGELNGGIKDGNQNIEFDSAHNFIPSTTNYISLGTSSKQYKNVYGQNIYVNGTAVSSDRRKKEDISPLDWRYNEFFKLLNPVAFKYTDGTSGRKHTGFIAQEVEKAVQKAGLSDKELAVV
ncbi:MAG: tail fiber domain-containing protein, partial [Ruminococcus sp.]|nr:tail fiber domain-containing protein [Ruminococcus sp.]